VMSGLSFRKLFSPTPCTFISSSIFLRRIIGVVFMRMNSKCAHQVRPPLAERLGLSDVRESPALVAIDFLVLEI
jgi:hypothetical protein